MHQENNFSNKSKCFLSAGAGAKVKEEEGEVGGSMAKQFGHSSLIVQKAISDSNEILFF